MTQGKMNPELKAKWVAALRSGKYEQERGDIGRGNKLCCLGVLSVVSGERRISNGVPGVLFWVDYIKTDHMTLVALNDGDPDNGNAGAKSFAQIADYIEEHL
jgi:hypothetical protein